MRKLAPLIAATFALGGCAPLQAPRPSSTASNELATPTKPQRADRTSISPTEAIAAFASAYINWDAQSVTGHMRALAAASVGQARSAMQLAAANTAQDYELRRGGIANSGTVEAIAPLRDARDRYVVVTRELTTATNTTAYQGLRPAWHVTLATVTELAPNAWVVSGWQPES